MKQRILIISASSDIGLALSKHWIAIGHEVIGTYRRASPAMEVLRQHGMKFIQYDLADARSTERGIVELRQHGISWDALVFCPGAQEPVGSFLDVDFAEWVKSIEINFTGQMRMTHALLPLRNTESPRGPLVLYFAGGGTNNATVNYSAYTISKIALIKMCELLDAEIGDSRFTILGPGWVKTKIHDATLSAGAKKAGGNYQRTIEKLAGNECNPMERVVACCDWVLTSPRALVSGRNFSVVFDAWGDAWDRRAIAAEPNAAVVRNLRREMAIKNGLKFNLTKLPTNHFWADHLMLTKVCQGQKSVDNPDGAEHGEGPSSEGVERLFIALQLPEAIKAALADLAEPIPGISWIRPNQFHLTLRFLGDVPAAHIEQLDARLATVHVGSFLLPVEGLGAFPPKSPPRILWAGVGHGHPHLYQLRQRLDDAVLAAGVDFDVRTFQPHVTLARCTEKAGAAASQWLRRHREFSAPPFRVESFDLCESQRLKTGVQHTVKRRYSLATGK